MAQGDAKSGSKFVQDFEKHWSNAKELAVAVANAMPEDGYSFKPTPAQMTFGEQMIHITGANYGYCAFIAGAKSPYNEPKDAKKDQIVKELGESFDYCTKTFDGMTEAKLDQNLRTGEHAVDAREVMLGVMIHMAHHRGQSEVYLRLKGVVPPEYKW
jgi:uncharacterized damage-inducible protein DinB